MNSLQQSFREHPVLPWLALYALGLASNAVGHFVFEPAAYVAAVLLLVAPAGVAVVGLLAIVRGSRTQRGLQWCALVGGAAVLVVHVRATFSSAADVDNSIGGWPMVLVAGYALMVASSGLTRGAGRATAAV